MVNRKYVGMDCGPSSRHQRRPDEIDMLVPPHAYRCFIWPCHPHYDTVPSARLHILRVRNIWFLCITAASSVSEKGSLLNVVLNPDLRDLLSCRCLYI